jgi:hypothetical protein
MAKARAERTRWVSYLRVSTVEQAEKELSLTAQRRSAEEFAARHEAVIDHHYVEPGASGTDFDPAPTRSPTEPTSATASSRAGRRRRAPRPRLRDRRTSSGSAPGAAKF